VLLLLPRSVAQFWLSIRHVSIPSTHERSQEARLTYFDHQLDTHVHEGTVERGLDRIDLGSCKDGAKHNRKVTGGHHVHLAVGAYIMQETEQVLLAHTIEDYYAAA